MSRRSINPNFDSLRPCGGTCGRMTRPSHFPKELAPEAVVRATISHCRSCATAAGLVKTGEPGRRATPERVRYAEAGLNSFMARRREREEKRKRERMLSA